MKISVLATAVATLLIGFPLASMAGLVPDTDNDGVPDPMDNCVAVANAAPIDCDSDIDGYGNICDCDYNNDYICGGPDFGVFGGDFGGPETAGAGTDQNCDGIVGGPDFGLFGGGFGGGPGPSGKGCAGSHPGGVGALGTCP